MKGDFFILKETAQEQAYHKLLSSDQKDKIYVTYQYKVYVQLIQRNLEHFYKNRVDWNQCIQQYFHSSEYQKQCHLPKSCEEIPLITTDDIRQMIAEDEQFHARRDAVLTLSQKIFESTPHENLQELYHAASLLGIFPSQSNDSLYHWLVLRDGMTAEEQEFIETSMRSDPGRLADILRLFHSVLMPGAMLTFPLIGTTLTQTKSQYFYRGENAYYGSSKPSIYRFGNENDPIIRKTRWLTISEAGFFLNQFDAVKHWSVSGVNYLALAQHYGVPTPMMDLTSDLKTALFFACCKYDHHRWRPLNREDFSASSGLKDPRYGIIYRSPTEITSMKWALSVSDSAEGIIMPIGYQPFMRCSAQHGYMLLADNERYDMLQDPLFDKFRFEHDEEFCHWIFEEMDQGAKVYPLDDVPDLESAMEEISSSHVISSKTFANLNLPDDQAYILRRLLHKAGYEVLNHPKEYITKKRLHKINKQYSYKIACQKLDLTPTSSPILYIPSDFLIDENQMVIPAP